MKLTTFFDKFDQFADAPNAVTKMRELVLELGGNGTPRCTKNQVARKAAQGSRNKNR